MKLKLLENFDKTNKNYKTFAYAQRLFLKNCKKLTKFFDQNF